MASARGWSGVRAVERVPFGRLAAALAGTVLALAPIVDSGAGAAATLGSRAGTPGDALERRVLAELGRFTSWLAAHGERGFVGEMGWPDRPVGDVPRWAAVAESWFDHADAHGLWVTAWATGEWWGNYRLAVYEDRSRPPGLDTPNVQAGVLEEHLGAGDVQRGVNVSGGEFGAPPSLARTSSFSNRRPGRYGAAYHYDRHASFAFLAARGSELVRLQFRWERVQRRPGGSLHRPELARLCAAVERAAGAGLEVILDLHNYGDYYLARAGRGVRRPLGSPALPGAALADLWRRLARRFRDEPGVIGYGLMNEPAGMRRRGRRSAAEVWEAVSQRALHAIRSAGDTRLVLVQGYSYAGAQRWPRVHPDPWITDPADNFRYEAHHYWDRDNSGGYTHGYAAEVANAARRGY